jgi:hypothetical protein
MRIVGETRDGRTLFEYNGVRGTYFDFDVNLKSNDDVVVRKIIAHHSTVTAILAKYSIKDKQ